MYTTKLIMFSGGPDSLYLLYDHIIKKKDPIPIHVHHIILKNNRSPRWKQELESSRKIISYFQKIRSFDYTESEWELSLDNGGFPTWDADIVAFTAAQIVPFIKNRKVQIVTGRIMDDDDSGLSVYQVEFAQKIWEASTEKFGDKAIKKIHRPLRHLWKKDLVTELLDNLPREIVDLTWSCWFPVNGEPCNKCGSCINFNEAKASLRQR